MILRNIAIRHGRKALAAPLQRSCVRTHTTFDSQDPPISNENTPLEKAVQNSAPLENSLPIEALPSSALPETREELKLAAFLRKKANEKPPNPNSKRQLRRKDWIDTVTNTRARAAINRTTNKLGSNLTHYYEPDETLRNPPKPENVTLEMLMAAQSHLGHATGIWNPMNQRYIFGIREGIHIISLEETAAHLRRAAKIVEGVAYHGGLVLFVGNRKGQGPSVVQASKLAQGCHLFERWIPGAITNGSVILRKCGIKAVDKDDNEVKGFEDKINEWEGLKPDLVVVLNPLENKILLHECMLNNIPTIGVIDTDADPTSVTYPIPANDDSLRCTQIIAGVLGRAGESGQRKRLEVAQQGEVTWIPPPRLGTPFDDLDLNKEEKAEVKLILDQHKEWKKVTEKKQKEDSVSIF